MIRNVASLMPPYTADGVHHGTSAAIEFAVRVLKVEHIIVLGHAGCGGIQHLLAHGQEFFVTVDEIARGARVRIQGVGTVEMEAR